MAAIAEKLVSLPFQKVVHKFVSPDVQPTAAGGALVSVLGQLLVDDSDAPLSYAQTFLLAKDAAGSWYVQNDIFKLVSFELAAPSSSHGLNRSSAATSHAISLIDGRNICQERQIVLAKDVLRFGFALSEKKRPFVWLHRSYLFALDLTPLCCGER